MLQHHLSKKKLLEVCTEAASEYAADENYDVDTLEQLIDLFDDLMDRAPGHVSAEFLGLTSAFFRGAIQMRQPNESANN